jgi:hypothetical protein
VAAMGDGVNESGGLRLAFWAVAPLSHPSSNFLRDPAADRNVQTTASEADAPVGKIPNSPDAVPHPRHGD